MNKKVKFALIGTALVLGACADYSVDSGDMAVKTSNAGNGVHDIAYYKMPSDFDIDTYLALNPDVKYFQIIDRLRNQDNKPRLDSMANNDTKAEATALVMRRLFLLSGNSRLLISVQCACHKKHTAHGSAHFTQPSHTTSKRRCHARQRLFIHSDQICKCNCHCLRAVIPLLKKSECTLPSGTFLCFLQPIFCLFFINIKHLYFLQQ